MKHLILLALVAIVLMSCESQSDKRVRATKAEVVVVPESLRATYLVHADAYLNDSIICSADYVVHNTKAYADSICTKKANSIAGFVLCDSIAMHITQVELVK